MQAKVLLTGILMVVLLSACTSSADEGLSPEQAARHVGETATVCGRIASSHYAETGDGQPTFVNLDKPYPKQVSRSSSSAITAQNSCRRRKPGRVTCA
jgi:hypothetical protein